MHGQVSDDYRFFSVVRDVGFPPQTTVTIKPTEPGIWQIIATSGPFISGKIFVTLTESYSYVSDKPNNVVKRDTCGKDLDGRYDRISMFDVASNSIIRNVKNDFMAEESYNDWKIITNPATDLIYIYEHYTTIVPIIYGNSGETKENLTLYGPRSSVRVSDIAINPETNLIYMGDNGRVSGKSDGRILVLDGENHSIISIIEYYDRSGEDEYVKSITVDPKTNTLYAMTGENSLYVIDLDTEEVVTKLHLGEGGYSGTHDVEVNSETNKIYALNGELYVIDGHTNAVEHAIPVDNWADKIQVNERDNEIYLLIYSTEKLLIIDGTDHQIDTINLHRPGLDMDFDHVHGKLYVPNEGGSVTVIDTDALEFDIMDDCSFISRISINPGTGVLSAVDESQSVTVNVIEDVKPHQNDRMWVDDSEYPRTEYLSDEQISFRLSNMGDADIAVDSVRIKNTNTGNVAVTLTESQTIEQNGFIEIMWDQTDSNGKRVPLDRYALIMKGHDDEDAIYEAHKLFSTIDKDRLDRLKSLHKDMFSYIKSNESNSEETTAPPASDDSAPANTADDLTAGQPQPDIPDDVACKNNPVLMTRNYEKFICVKFTTSETLVMRGWEIVSTEPTPAVPSDTSENITVPKHDIMPDFPLSSEFTGNIFARFNVEFSQRPVLNEEFDITIKYEIFDNESSNKKPRKTVPFTLTLGEGMEYVGGDMNKIARKYSLVTEQYNTMYKAENPSTVPGIYESTSIIKFSQPGEHYFGLHVSGQFDGFWFFVDDGGTVYLKEDVIYDSSALSQLMHVLTANYPESIEDELETIFGSNAKRVLEDYYEYYEYQRPIAPVDLLTTKVQLQDVVCSGGIFYKFTQSEWGGHGMQCGSESTLEYNSERSREVEVYDRNEAIKALTINTDSVAMSEKNIFFDTRDNDYDDGWFPSRQSAHKDKAVLPPPYHYLGEPCSNDALYATFEAPEQVNVGDAFDVVLTYSWTVPNPNWDVMSEDDKKTMQNLRDEYLPLVEAEEMANSGGGHATLTEPELDDLGAQMDALLDRMAKILDKYGLEDHDSNIYGYQITEYYPECKEPILNIAFPEELEILSDGFEISGSPDQHKIVNYRGEKTLSFSNDQPQTYILTMIANEPTFHLVNSLRINAAGYGANFVFSVNNGTVTFTHNYPDYLERLAHTPQIDKFGNKIPRHEQSGGGYSLNSVLFEYSQLHGLSVDKTRQLQLEFLKHQVLNPDDDFTTFYKIFSGTDISDEIDYVSLGPPMDSFAEFAREHILQDEDDIEAWLYSIDDLHDDWIEAFLAKYPEFKNET